MVSAKGATAQWTNLDNPALATFIAKYLPVSKTDLYARHSLKETALRTT